MISQRVLRTSETEAYQTCFVAYYHQALNEYPFYISMLPNGSQDFVGVQEFQLWGNTLAFSRIEYRYKHKKDIFILLI